MSGKTPAFVVPAGIQLSPEDTELAERIHYSEWSSAHGVYPGTVVIKFREGAKRLLAAKYPGLYPEKDQPC